MPAQPMLSEVIDSYLDHRRSRYAPTTLANEAFVLRRFLAEVGDVQLRHLRPERVEAWFASLLDEHVTRNGVVRPRVEATTANYYRTRLLSLFRYARARGLLRGVDPLVHVEPMRTERKRRLQPSPAQMLAMLDHTDNDRDRCFIALATNTGLRAGEIVRLRVADVDLDQGLLRVVITKSGTEDLQPITLDLDRELRIWLTTYVMDLRKPLRDEDHLFPARVGAKYVWRVQADGSKVRGHTASNWRPDMAMTHPQRVVQAALRALGLPTKGEGVHTLRRAAARAFFDSMVAEEGFDGALRTVSAMLHHKSSAVTELYIGLDAERRRRDERLRGRPFLTTSTAMSHDPAGSTAIRPEPMPQAPRPRRPQRPPGKSGAG